MILLHDYWKYINPEVQTFLSPLNKIFNILLITCDLHVIDLDE